MRDLLPFRRLRPEQARVQARPDVLGRASSSSEVFDLEQAALLKVRAGDPPAALEVAVEAIAEHVAKRRSTSCGRRSGRSGSGAYRSRAVRAPRTPSVESVVCETARSPAAAAGTGAGRTEQADLTKSLKWPA